MIHLHRPLRAALLLGALSPFALAAAQQPPAAEDPPAAQEPDPGPQPQEPPARPRGGADPSDDAFEMGSPPSLPEGLQEEDMWPAATAEGWRKPCLVHWQRSFDDAVRVANARHEPILVAVNMDGEIASEHWAGVRYRQEETAAQLARYACVVASVYRHTPRDYDEQGRRVECPRFGTVTCGEHIEAERELYDEYFDGRRVAPRHIVLGLDGSETYDVFYTWDTKSVVTTFVRGVEGWPEPLERLEPTLENLAASADVADREQLERAYRAGDRETRRRILRLLTEHRVVDQTEVLRTALFGFDLELASLARRALAQCETEGALDLMAEALKTPLAEPDRALLLDAVERLAPGSKRARTLLALHSGLSLESRHLEPATPEERAREYEENAERALDVQARARAAEARPEEPETLLGFSEALLARALEEPQRKHAELLYEDAHNYAREAERRGARGARLDAVVALLAERRGERDTARERAVAAVEAGLLRGEDGASASPLLSRGGRTRLLLLFADARRGAIRAAYRRGEEWPPEWLSDVNAAYTEVSEDPAVDAEALVGFYDFLRWIGATPRANTVLDDALARHPDAPVLHERLRARLLWEGGPEGLERGYAERLAAEREAGGEPTQLTWFAGYAALVAAEHHRRRGEFEAALAAYDRAVARFGLDAERFPDGRDNCAHFTALGLAGRARVNLERGELAAATTALLESLRRRPDSAASADGLNITPAMTARMLRARLLEAGDAERAARVQDALDALDPRLLEPPPEERPDLGRRGGGRGRRGGGSGD